MLKSESVPHLKLIHNLDCLTWLLLMIQRLLMTHALRVLKMFVLTPNKHMQKVKTEMSSFHLPSGI